MCTARLSALQRYLAAMPNGRIHDLATLEPLLIDCWDAIQGADDCGMEAFKLRGRMEQVEWQSPRLSFMIERHGGTVAGSSRATLQRWVIDVMSASAECAEQGYRQLAQPGSPLYTRPLVAEIAEHIIQGKDHFALQWLIDRSRVHLRVGEIIPENGPKRTISGRRSRFNKALVECLSAAGWFQVPNKTYHTYEKQSAP